MKKYRSYLPLFYKLAISISLLSVIFIANGPAISAGHKAADNTVHDGYSVLKLFLKDEQHLTSIRRVKTVLTFKGISDDSTKLIDNIADSSAQALDELDKLAASNPAIVFKDFSDDSIGKATLDSLRIATAREFLFEANAFEKNLLLSQSQILRVISHLAKQLEEKETNTKRKAWLHKLAKRYEKYYQQVFARLSISDEGKA